MYDTAIHRYFRWLVNIVGPSYNGKPYWKMLWCLFNTDYIYELDMDGNRADDGLELRKCFEEGNPKLFLDLNHSCSVLEMMIALAMRCERDIMYIPSEGDRTYIWFWNMVGSLGLLRMTDEYYDAVIVKAIMFNFLNRMYEPDGKGGLFYVPGSEQDMRNIEIWYQMNVWLQSYVE